MRKVALVILMLSVVAEAQTPLRDGLFLETQDQSINMMQPPLLTGDLSEDLFAVSPGAAAQKALYKQETQSALRAGLLSLIVPGSGQAIEEHNYWVAAGFFAVEVAAWTVNLMWTRKANNQESYYKMYADGTAADNYQNAHYSVIRYAQWIQTNYQQLEQVNLTTPQGQQIIAKYVNDLLPAKINPAVAPWEQVNWTALNAIEGAMGGYFTHQLFPHGNFEYYELIGKYPQFRQGWDDSPYALWVKGGEKGPAPIDYSQTDTPSSGYYMNQRGLANHLFDISTIALSAVLVNHFASAIEAAVAAHVHNKNIHAHVSMTPLPMGMGYQTQLQIGIDF